MASVTVKVLNEPKARGKAVMCSVITNAHSFGDIVMFGADVRDRFESRLIRGRFYRLVSVTTVPKDGGRVSIKLSSKTRVFATVPFDVPGEMEDMFYNAPEMAIGDVLGCSESKRVTIVGRVKTVSPVKEGGSWTRKEVCVADLSGRQAVTVNLWGEQSQLAADVNDVVRVTNCEAVEYRDAVSLNGTQETHILVGGNALF
ncbi:uncharacterized protein LOC119732834 [Patiria miniata]|uniref:Replication protein A OB domain-containing protein n=1 Tax=Patiria miniata TaxID=46514 RepID=A0A914AFT3_PATMI|nr:uncharacterized protein LOC119732834 [Patiria miniata]